MDVEVKIKLSTARKIAEAGIVDEVESIATQGYAIGWEDLRCKLKRYIETLRSRAAKESSLTVLDVLAELNHEFI